MVEVDLIGGCSQRPVALSHVTPSPFRPSCQNATDDCIQMIQNAYSVDARLQRVPWMTFDVPSPSRSPHPLCLDPAVGTEAHLLALCHLYHHGVAHLCMGLK